jgi:hypothetical protein
MLLLALWSTLGSAVEPRPALPKEPVVVARTERPLELIVKFHDATGARSNSGRVRLGAELDAVTAAHGLGFRPLLYLPESDLQALRERAERRSGRRQPDLGTMLVVDLPDPTPAAVERAANALLALDQVEWVSVGVRLVPPPGDLPPETPDLSDRQGYHGPDPGLDVEAAWELGFRGEGIRLSDCEYGWLTSHEDLVDIGIELEDGQTPDPLVEEYDFDEHGTAVVGIMSAPDNGYGVTGLVPGAHVAVFSEWTRQDGSRRVDAIAAAVAASEPGDVVVLEMQAPLPSMGDYDYGPAELEAAVWTVTRQAADAGVIVVAAAGNGAQNLDGSIYAAYRDRGDSGAIIVGAGSANSRHEPLYFTTYGERVDLQGWGEATVTAGYGSLNAFGGWDDAEQYYSDDFGGTSGATPMVASAAVILSQAITTYTGEPATPEEVREILVQTGIEQGGSEPIGPFPDLAAALAEVRDRYAPGVGGLIGPPTIDEGRTVTLSVDPTWLSGDGGEVGWVWDDGVTGSGDSLERSFPDDGEYEVELTLEDATGETRVVTRTVEVANVAPFLDEVDPKRKLRDGRERRLEALFHDPGDDTVQVSWEFDDGTVATGTIVEHAFDGVGPHEVIVTLTDEDGGETVETVTLDVRKRGCGCDGGGGAWGLSAVVALLALRRRLRSS